MEIISAKNLRIGNYIASGANKNNKETWVIGKVCSIGNLDAGFEQIEVETEESFEWFFKDNYFGIPITFCGLAVVLMPPNRCYMKCRLI